MRFVPALRDTGSTVRAGLANDAVVDLESRAAVHRHRLVTALRDRGIENSEMLAAFMAVPRHRFVDRSWVGGTVEGSEVDHSVMRTINDSVSEEDLAFALGFSHPEMAQLREPQTKIARAGPEVSEVYEDPARRTSRSVTPTATASTSWSNSKRSCWGRTPGRFDR